MLKPALFLAAVVGATVLAVVSVGALAPHAIADARRRLTEEGEEEGEQQGIATPVCDEFYEGNCQGDLFTAGCEACFSGIDLGSCLSVPDPELFSTVNWKRGLYVSCQTSVPENAIPIGPVMLQASVKGVVEVRPCGEPAFARYEITTELPKLPGGDDEDGANDYGETWDLTYTGTDEHSYAEASKEAGPEKQDQVSMAAEKKTEVTFFEYTVHPLVGTLTLYGKMLFEVSFSGGSVMGEVRGDLCFRFKLAQVVRDQIYEYAATVINQLDAGVCSGDAPTCEDLHVKTETYALVKTPQCVDCADDDDCGDDEPIWSSCTWQQIWCWATQDPENDTEDDFGTNMKEALGIPDENEEMPWVLTKQELGVFTCEEEELKAYTPEQCLEETCQTCVDDYNVDGFPLKGCNNPTKTWQTVGISVGGAVVGIGVLAFLFSCICGSA
jgi:hypothetical protein